MIKTIFSALLLSLLAPGMLSAQGTDIRYQDGSQQLQGILTQPDNKATPKGGILILPAWKGIDEHSKQVAADLSKLGYYTFIADIYGAGNYPATGAEAAKQSGYYKQHIADYQRRIALALAQLQNAVPDKNKIVVIGYCFGGLGAIEAARINMPVKGIVSFHGSYSRDSTRAIKPIQPSVLILHGADDPHAPPKETEQLRQEMKTANADWQMVYYGNAVHAFTEKQAGNDNSKGAAYNEKADQRSWRLLLSFLEEML